MKFKLVVEQSNDGGYVAGCANLLGCVSQGKTKDEAIKNVQNAIKAYLSCIKNYNGVMPADNEEDLSIIPEMTNEDILKTFKKIGFREDQNIGGHTLLRQISYPNRIITIPNDKALSKVTLRNLIRQSGLTITEFKQMV